MKKLNRKGFTLVELLAVIIILAIVVGITIPAVLTTTNNAKRKAFENAAASAADWIDRQYQVAITGISVGSNSVATLDPNFTSICTETNEYCSKDTPVSADANLIASAGLSANNVSAMTITINPSTGRSCVTLTANPNGDYAGFGDSNGNTKTGGVC